MYGQLIYGVLLDLDNNLLCYFFRHYKQEELELYIQMYLDSGIFGQEEIKLNGNNILIKNLINVLQQ